MKLKTLTESRGEEVMAFSDALEDFDGSSTSKETVDQMRAVGSMLFKSGFKFKMDEPGDLEFSYKSDEGLTVVASIAYKFNGKWVLHVEGFEKNLKIEWDGLSLDTAASMTGDKLVKTVNGVFASIDEADAIFGTRCKIER